MNWIGKSLVVQWHCGKVGIKHWHGANDCFSLILENTLNKNCTEIILVINTTNFEKQNAFVVRLRTKTEYYYNYIRYRYNIFIFDLLMKIIVFCILVINCKVRLQSI